MLSVVPTINIEKIVIKVIFDDNKCIRNFRTNLRLTNLLIK